MRKWVFLVFRNLTGNRLEKLTNLLELRSCSFFDLLKLSQAFLFLLKTKRKVFSSIHGKRLETAQEK